MDKILLGMFPNSQRLERVIDTLHNEGFNPKNISIVMRDNREAAEMEDKTGVNVAEGAVSGATTGGLLGAAAGLLVGIGAIAIPGIGALLIGGPLAAALGLTGAAATTATGAITGALAGGLVGGLVNLGVPEKEAKVYEQRVLEGGVLLAVPITDDQEERVRDLLESHGASDFSTIAAGDFDTAKAYSSQSSQANRSSNIPDGEDRVIANPVQVQRYLDNMDYPASKDELISHAISHGADERVQNTLRNLSNRRYRSPKEVSEEIGKIK